VIVLDIIFIVKKFKRLKEIKFLEFRK